MSHTDEHQADSIAVTQADVLSHDADAEPVHVDQHAPVADKPAHQWSTILGPIVVFLLFIGFWEYMHRDGMRSLLGKKPSLLPSPVTVIDQAFLDSVVRKQLLIGLGWTTYAAAIGLGITIVLGMGLAVLMARAVWLERSIYPYLVALQATPVLAIVPII
ncbi:MAG TPA: hypothetical protein PK020_07080, partial [Ilumatobacteraceae bacterium]|nr:hypothetical protein [Ilumatobacteraceae bacterium]